ncbi:MAG: phenylalanine--tRNA ligase subunit beta [Anaerolineales bacterium]|nr:phenylalanine--tRNA ligase subunit beta [Anaerolineales bacterium]
MKVPISWLQDYVEVKDIPIEELAHRLTLAGLEVEEINFVGMAPPPGDRHDFKVTGLPWNPEKIVVAEVLEVMPHPNADRLVLCQLNDGEMIHTVLTGAPNLYPYKGTGPLSPTLKVAYAREGAEIYDGHQEGLVVTRLKRTKIRGVESYSMICSEKELGISEEHEGILFLPEDAPVGIPLADYMGDAVLDIAITPNIARNANIYGVARETAAVFKRKLRHPNYEFLAEGGPIEGKVSIQIEDAEMNPRFVVGLIENIEIKPSPERVQRRLKLIDQRPINNIVDATNYVMFDIGQPLHAFDYDQLVRRAGGEAPTLITRAAKPGEKITTLDGEERELEDFTTLICDTAGAHSLAGIMGGLETEVTGNTTNVLLEGANWNYINIRKSLSYLKMHSEASYRFSRGVHPAMAERGVRMGLELMRQWSGGVICKGLIDQYPSKAEVVTVEVTSADVRRWLGITLSGAEISELLSRLEFDCQQDGEAVLVTVPDHRVDIEPDPINGKADLMEEIARIYGYDNIPETRLADVIPTQRNAPKLDFEEKLRDLLVREGLQEVISYRLTSPEREAKRLPPDVEDDPKPYVKVINPIAVDRFAMRKSLLSSVLENVEYNARIRERIAVFEIGSVFLASEEGRLPEEQDRLVVAVTGPRQTTSWQDSAASGNYDFYDLKGIVDSMLNGLHVVESSYKTHTYPSFHPGKTAAIYTGETMIGVMGELHPMVHNQYSFTDAPVLAAIFFLEKLMQAAPPRHEVSPVSAYPPVLEDIALIVDEGVPAGQVSFLIQQTGGSQITDVRLFDVYRGEQLGAGKKSLAYSLTYQAPDRTLTDSEVAKIRTKIVKRLEREVNAQLRDN